MSDDVFKAAADDGYRALGRYVACFSGVIRRMAIGVGLYLGRPPSGQPLSRIVLGVMTAQQVCDVYFGIVNLVSDLDAEDKKVLKILRAQVNAAITRRNDFAHGDWHFGFGSSDAPGVPLDPMLHRVKPMRAQGPFVFSDVPVADIDRESDALVDIQRCLERVDLCVATDHWRLRDHIEFTTGLARTRQPPDGE